MHRGSEMYAFLEEAKMGYIVKFHITAFNFAQRGIHTQRTGID